MKAAINPLSRNDGKRHLEAAVEHLRDEVTEAAQKGEKVVQDVREHPASAAERIASEVKDGPAARSNKLIAWRARSQIA